MDNKQFNHRVGAMMSTFQRINRTMSDADVTVTYAPEVKEIIAFSKGSDVFFGHRAINKDIINKPGSLIALNGLNYHELCHIIYTPRHHRLPSEIKRSSQRMQVMNALEDQRIETIFTALYPNTVSYFRMAVIHHLLQTENAKPERIFPLIYGRKYLFKSIITAYETQYEKPGDIDEFKSIIDEYIALDGSIESQPQTYIDLIDRYIKLLPKADDGTPDTEGSCSHESGGDPGTEQVVISISDIEGDGGAPISMDGAEDDSEGEGDGESAEDGNNPGTKPGTSPVDKAIEKAKESIMEDYEVINYIRGVRQIAQSQTGEIYGMNTPKAKYDNQPTDAVISNITTKVSERYRALVEDSDPGYHSHQSHGRINIDRVMRDSPLDTIFDRWDSGKNDATDIEVVVGLDVSGSMAGREEDLGRVGWSLKRALGALGERCKVSIYTYSHDHRELYSRDEACPSSIRVPVIYGGTDPRGFLDSAMHIMTNTNRTHRIMLMMTDGEWSQAEKCESKIRKMNNDGVITGLYHFGHGRNTHDVQVFKSSSDLSGLIEFTDSLVALAQKNIG